MLSIGSRTGIVANKEAMMKVAAIILLLSSSVALAKGAVDFQDPSNTCSACKQSTTKRNMRDIRNVNVSLMPIIGSDGQVVMDEDGKYKDSRGDIFENGPKLSGSLALSSREVMDLNSSTPTIKCSSSSVVTKPAAATANGNKPIQTASVQVRRTETSTASGFLYGNCMQYATAAHALRDENGNLHKSCVLKAGKDSALKDDTPLNMSMIEVMKDPTGHPDGEIAVIKLKSKPFDRPGVECIGLNTTGRTVGFREKLGVVSSIQYKGDRSKAGVRDENQVMGGPGEHSIAQECPRPFDRRIVNTPIFFGNCTTTKMASGSLGYSRDSNTGKLRADVIFVGGGKPHMDWTKFVIDEDPEKTNYAHGVILDQAKVARMIEFQNRVKLEGMEANARKTH